MSIKTAEYGFQSICKIDRFLLNKMIIIKSWSPSRSTVILIFTVYKIKKKRLRNEMHIYYFWYKICKQILSVVENMEMTKQLLLNLSLLLVLLFFLQIHLQKLY
ncbi:hypothetical protein J2S21_000529 [Peribacillus cavernae]|nr:hypothetical protein [Peribacillus cavernae]